MESELRDQKTIKAYILILADVKVCFRTVVYSYLI